MNYTTLRVVKYNKFSHSYNNIVKKGRFYHLKIFVVVMVVGLVPVDS